MSPNVPFFIIAGLVAAAMLVGYLIYRKVAVRDARIDGAFILPGDLEAEIGAFVADYRRKMTLLEGDPTPIATFRGGYRLDATVTFRDLPAARGAPM